MAESSSFKVCILWEEEVRMASRLLKSAYAEGLTPEEEQTRLKNALKACLVALWGVDDDAGCVILGSRDLQETVRRNGFVTDSTGEPAK